VKLVKARIRRYRSIEDAELSDLGLALIDHLHTWRPAFVYFGDYDSMPGKVSVPDFEARREANTLTRGEQALLSLLELAGVALEDFKHSDSHEHLIRDLENASNGISDEVFEYWSQNTDLAVKLGVLGSPEPDAAPPLSQPPLLQIRVENKRHRVMSRSTSGPEASCGSSRFLLTSISSNAQRISR
jgi:hypothetical protein